MAHVLLEFHSKIKLFAFSFDICNTCLWEPKKFHSQTPLVELKVSILKIYTFPLSASILPVSETYISRVILFGRIEHY